MLVILFAWNSLQIWRLEYVTKRKWPFPTIALWKKGGLEPKTEYWVLTKPDKIIPSLKVLTMEELRRKDGMRHRFLDIPDRDDLPSSTFISAGRRGSTSWELYFEEGSSRIKINVFQDF